MEILKEYSFEIILAYLVFSVYKGADLRKYFVVKADFAYITLIQTGMLSLFIYFVMDVNISPLLLIGFCIGTAFLSSEMGFPKIKKSGFLVKRNGGF